MCRWYGGEDGGKDGGEDSSEVGGVDGGCWWLCGSWCLNGSWWLSGLCGCCGGGGEILHFPYSYHHQ